jgi:hypothetical protein
MSPSFTVPHDGAADPSGARGLYSEAKSYGLGVEMFIWVRSTVKTIGQPGRPRMIAFYVLAGLMTVAAAVEMVNHVIDDSISPHHIHSLAHALVEIAVLVALASQLWRPAQHIVGIQQLLVLAIASSAADALSARFGGLEVILFVFAAVLAPLHPARRELLRFGGVQFRILVVAAVACVPLVIFALGQAGLQRAGFEPAHAAPGHWSWMVGLALGIGLLAVLAAIVPSGRRIPGYTAAALMVAFGVGSLIFAAEPSALPIVWALVAIVGSLAFVAVMETDRAGSSAGRVALDAAKAESAKL